jgi:hypothetical protein
MTPFEFIIWEQSRTHTADPHKKPGLQKQALSPLFVPFELFIELQLIVFSTQAEPFQLYPLLQ